MKRPIAIGLAPNLEIDDIILALKNIISGKIFFNPANFLVNIDEWFKNNLDSSHNFFLNSGRSALLLALGALNLTKQDEVIVQAFTCVAVPNSVIWAGAKPIYADINNNDLGIDIVDLKKKITNKTKAIIVQHTFGIPANIEEIIIIARKNNIVVIEDCAHTLKTKYKNKYLGCYGDMSIFSFGRDKVVSSVFGGALIVNNQKYLPKIKSLYDKLNYSSTIWNLQQHFHSIAMLVILPLYDFFNIGKFLLYLMQKIKLLVPPVYKEEKLVQRPLVFPEKLSYSIMILALRQLSKIDRFNKTRIKFAEIYNNHFKNSSLLSQFPVLRYLLMVEERDKLFNGARKKGIYLGKWYSEIIDPKGVDLKKVNYTHCPIAENVAQHIINLPTYPSLTDKEQTKIITFIKRGNYRII